MMARWGLWLVAWLGTSGALAGEGEPGVPASTGEDSDGGVLARRDDEAKPPKPTKEERRQAKEEAREELAEAPSEGNFFWRVFRGERTLYPNEDWGVFTWLLALQPEEIPPDKRVFASIAPSFRVSPLLGFAIGATANMALYAGDPAETNLSSAYGQFLYGTKGQLISQIINFVYFDQDRWSIRGITRWQRFPQEAYGIGGNTPEDRATLTTRDQFTFRQIAYRKVWKDLHVGVGWAVDYAYGIDDLGARETRSRIWDLRGDIADGDGLSVYEASDYIQDLEDKGYSPQQLVDEGLMDDVEDASISSAEIQRKYFETPFQQYPYGTTRNYLSNGLQVGVLWDSRDNQLNAYEGYFAEASYRGSFKGLGSTYEWHSLYLDARGYHKLLNQPRFILAWWALGWFTFGDVPYFELPGTGQDLFQRAARGYVAARYLGNHMLYGEVEFRYRVRAWLGAVAFVNVHSVTERDLEFKYVNPAGGFGIRLLFTKHSRANIAIDWGFGKDGSNAIYVQLNETF